MKNKLFRVLLVAAISVASGIAIGYLKDEENWKEFKKKTSKYSKEVEKKAKPYLTKLEKQAKVYAKQAKKLYTRKLKEYQI